MKIENNKVVSILYKVFDKNNVLVEAIKKDDPLVFLQGEKILLDKIEQELEGKSKGDVVILDLDAKDAYGEYLEELNNRPFPKNMFGEHADSIELGQLFQIEGIDGPAIAKVSGFDGDNVLMDLNQPLAGENLRFEFEILDVRDATPEELEQGVAIAPNSHDHGVDCGCGGHHH